MNEDMQHVHRYAWPLRVALVKVKDPIHQDWLQQQITRASILLSNVGISIEPGAGGAAALFADPG